MYLIFSSRSCCLRCDGCLVSHSFTYYYIYGMILQYCNLYWFIRVFKWNVLSTTDRRIKIHLIFWRRSMSLSLQLTSSSSFLFFFLSIDIYLSLFDFHYTIIIHTLFHRHSERRRVRTAMPKKRLVLVSE